LWNGLVGRTDHLVTAPIASACYSLGPEKRGFPLPIRETSETLSAHETPLHGEGRPARLAEGEFDRRRRRPLFVLSSIRAFDPTRAAPALDAPIRFFASSLGLF
jgi:hypothetical protein